MKFGESSGRAFAALSGVVLLGALLAACGSSGGSTSGGGGSTAASSSTGTTATTAASTCSPETKIGMLVVAPVPLFSEMVAGFKQGYSAQTGIAEGEIQIDEENAQGEPSNFQSMAQQFASGPDEILGAIGTPVTISLAQVTKEKPIVTIDISDPVGPGLAKSLQEPGTNVTGSVDSPNGKQVLSDMLAMEPNLKKVGTVFTTGNEAITPFNKQLDEAGEEDGVEIVKIGVGGPNEVSSAAHSLVGKVEAILIGRDAEVAAALPSIASVASQASVPVYLGYTGEGSLIPGVVGGYGTDSVHVGMLAGEVAGKICEGAEPATTPFAINHEYVWEFRRDELEKYGLSVPASLQGRSKVVAGEAASE